MTPHGSDDMAGIDTASNDTPGLCIDMVHQSVEVDAMTLYLKVIEAPDTSVIRNYVINIEQRFREVTHFQKDASKVSGTFIQAKLDTVTLRNIYQGLLHHGHSLLQKGALRQWRPYEEQAAYGWARPSEFMPWFVCPACIDDVLYVTSPDVWKCEGCQAMFTQAQRNQEGVFWKNLNDGKYLPIIRAEDDPNRLSAYP